MGHKDYYILYNRAFITYNRMSRLIVLALLVTLAAVASAQFGNNQFGYLGYGYGGNYGWGNNGFNQQYYPNIQPGYGFYNQQPYGGFGGCQYWCRSFNNQYYCCTNAGNVFGFNYGRQTNE